MLNNHQIIVLKCVRSLSVILASIVRTVAMTIVSAVLHFFLFCISVLCIQLKCEICAKIAVSIVCSYSPIPTYTDLYQPEPTCTDLDPRLWIFHLSIKSVAQVFYDLVASKSIGLYVGIPSDLHILRKISFRCHPN